jgi:hypothetical protein
LYGDRTIERGCRSREAFERFMEEKLGPALGEVMGGPPPEGGAPQYFPIDVLIIPH